MSVQRTLELALACLGGNGRAEVDAEAIDDARRWLARTEIFLDWITRHPRLVEINCEAQGLLDRYRDSER